MNAMGKDWPKLLGLLWRKCLSMITSIYRAAKTLMLNKSKQNDIYQLLLTVT